MDIEETSGNTSRLTCVSRDSSTQTENVFTTAAHATTQTVADPCSQMVNTRIENVCLKKINLNFDQAPKTKIPKKHSRVHFFTLTCVTTMMFSLTFILV